MSSTAPRVSSTPYARRLARERGVALGALAGTGPNGRVTGADVLRFAPTQAVPVAQVVAPASTPAPFAAMAALAATVDLAAIRDLLGQFADLTPKIELVDVCLKAAAATLRVTPGSEGAIALTIGKDVRILSGLHRLTLGAIASTRNETVPAGVSDVRPALTLSFLPRSGIRPVSIPVGPDGTARLVVAGDASADRAECLFSYDPARIDDDNAADFLLAFKAAMEVPLRLIA